MTPAQALAAFFQGLIQLEVDRYSPNVISKLPNVLGQLVSEVAGLPAVKEWEAKVEAAAAHEVVELLGKAFAAIKGLVESHVSASVKAKVDSALSGFVLHLDADDVRTLSQLAAAGKLKEALHQLAHDVLGVP